MFSFHGAMGRDGNVRDLIALCGKRARNRRERRRETGASNAAKPARLSHGRQNKGQSNGTICGIRKMGIEKSRAKNA